jgi:hypothetical protein
MRTNRKTRSIATTDHHHLLRGRGVTTTGRKPSTKAAHRSLRGGVGAAELLDSRRAT